MWLEMPSKELLGQNLASLEACLEKHTQHYLVALVLPLVLALVLPLQADWLVQPLQAENATTCSTYAYLHPAVVGLDHHANHAAANLDPHHDWKCLGSSQTQCQTNQCQP